MIGWGKVRHSVGHSSTVASSFQFMGGRREGQPGRNQYHKTQAAVRAAKDRAHVSLRKVRKRQSFL